MEKRHEQEAAATPEKTPQEQETAEVRRTPFTDEELEYFRQLILERRRQAVEDIERMKAQLEDTREQAGNDSPYSFHMADAGTDAMEREKLFLMIARQQKYIGYLDRALERIKNKTYGICKVTGKLSPKSDWKPCPIPKSQLKLS